jgi:hypothetical protein
MRKLEGYKSSLTVTSKRATQKTQEEDDDSFNFFEKIDLNPSLVPTSYLPHF